MDKHALRKRMLAARDKIGGATRTEKSVAACDCLFSSSPWKDSSGIAVFVSIKNEFPTAAIIERAWQEGKAVSAPRIVDRQRREMVFLSMKSWSDLIPGSLGIPEPSCGTPIQFSPKDLMLLPGLAFDKSGWRIGYGGGFYDHFLTTLAVEPRLIGLCFSEQIIDDVPHDSFDVPVDGICSDAGLEWITHDSV